MMGNQSIKHPTLYKTLYYKITVYCILHLKHPKLQKCSSPEKCLLTDRSVNNKKIPVCQQKFFRRATVLQLKHSGPLTLWGCVKVKTRKKQCVEPSYISIQLTYFVTFKWSFCHYLYWSNYFNNLHFVTFYINPYLLMKIR